MVQYLHFRILKFSLTWWTSLTFDLTIKVVFDSQTCHLSMSPLLVSGPAGCRCRSVLQTLIIFLSIDIIHHDHIYGGFLKRGYLQIIHYKRIFQNNTSILGYHHLWKPPCMFTIFPCETSVRSTLFFQVVLEVVAMLSAEAVQELLAIRSRRNDVGDNLSG
jgi:hypothetical protein